MMDIAQIPDPPLDLLSQSVKRAGYTTPGPASWQQSTKKKARALAEGYKCQVTVFENDEGRLVVRFPPSLGREKASAMLKGGLDSLSDSRSEAKTPKKGKQPAHGSHRGSKRDGSPCLNSPLSMTVEVSNRPGLIPVMKRRRVDEHRTSSQTPVELDHEGQESMTLSQAQNSRGLKTRLAAKNYPHMLSIRVDDHEGWREWMDHAFKAVQQTGCRFLAKEWIRLIHPKKQSTHPYNGRRPRDVQASPERTKPPYWPIGVIHKEPDHISKELRIELLIHLLMNTPQEEITIQCPEGGSGKKIVASDLLKVLDVKKPEIEHKMEIIREIIAARTDIEGYESAGIDGDMIRTVPDFSDVPRKEKPTKPSATNSVNHALSEPYEQEVGDNAVVPSPAPSPTEIDAVPTDDEDESSLLNTSFYSNMTEDSSASLVHSFQSEAHTLMKKECATHEQPREQHAVNLSSGPSVSGINYDPYVHTPSAQQPLQPSWSSSAELVGPFPDNSMLYANYSALVPPDFFSASRPSAVHSIVPPTMGYHGNQPYDPYYLSQSDRDLLYRPTADGFGHIVHTTGQGAEQTACLKPFEHHQMRPGR